MFDEFRRLVPTQIRRSYAAKFGIVLLVIGVSVGLIGSAATVQITNEVQDNVDQEYEDIAEQQAGAVEQWIQRNELTTRTMGGTQVLELGGTARLDVYLHNELEQLPPDVHSLHVVEADSGTVTMSTRLEQHQDVTDKPWWDDVEASYDDQDDRAVKMSDVYMAEDESLDGDRETSIAFVNLVSDDDDRVLVAEVSTAEHGPEQFAPVERADLVQVVDGDDNIIMSEDRDDLTELTPYPTEDGVDRPLVEARQEGGVGVVSMDGNEHVMEEDYVVSYAPVEGTDWVVLTHTQHSEAYGFVATVSQIGLMATFVGVALITVLGAFLGRNTATAIDRLTAKTQRMEEGDLSVDFQTHRIDNIGRLYQGFGSMQEALREQIQESQAARQEAESAREEAEMMNRHLEEKADEYSEVMRECASGDLTRRMDSESENAAMAEIAREFNAMIEEIELTTETVKEFATEVATSSEEVTASSEEVKGASEQVTDSIQEITDGAERQNDQLQSVAQEMNSLSTTIEEIAASANQVAQLSQQTAETGDDARERAEVAIHEMETVEAESEATVDAMEQLQSQIEQIEEITEFITDVAEQTNILALNANIEAARAGEAGEGFAVVAEEVKSLAEDTRQAAAEIDELVENVRDQTEHTAREVEQTSEEVARSTDIVEETVEALDEIAGYAVETNTGVQEISDATADQAASTNQVVSMVDDAATISEQTSRESENVAAAAEQQTTALTEVTTSASDLAEQASQLSSALERFDTDSEGREAVAIEDMDAEEIEDVEATDIEGIETPTLDEIGEAGDFEAPDFDSEEVADATETDDAGEPAPGESGTVDREDGETAEAGTSPDQPGDGEFGVESDAGTDTGDDFLSGGAVDDSLPFDLNTEGTGSIEIGDIDDVIGDAPDDPEPEPGKEDAADREDDETLDRPAAAREEVTEEWFDAQELVREDVETELDDGTGGNDEDGDTDPDDETADVTDDETEAVDDGGDADDGSDAAVDESAAGDESDASEETGDSKSK